MSARRGKETAGKQENAAASFASESASCSSEEDYRYEEVFPGKQRSVEEGEEDLQVALTAAREAEEETRATQRRHIPNIPEAVDDFLQNFLQKLGLSRTLRSFQAEWYGSVRDSVFIPDALTHKRLLLSELAAVRTDTERLQQTVLAAGENLGKMRRERDFHRMQHLRVSQEKSRLVEDVERLRKHYESYEPALLQLRKKHQAALRQKMLLSLDRDRLKSTTKPGFTEKKHQKKTDNSATNIKTITLPAHKAPPPERTECPVSIRVGPHLDQTRSPIPWEDKSPGSFSISCSIKAHELPISCLDLHPHKHILASASDDHLWRLWVGQMLLTGEGHTDWLSGCSFHPDGGQIATTSGDTTVRLWDFTHGCCLLTLSGHSQATWGCTFHSFGDVLASCSADGTVRLWDLSSQRCRRTLRHHSASVSSVSFLPLSDLLLTCSVDRTVCLFDTRLGICTQMLRGHQHPCSHAAFSPQGNAVASCDAHGVVKLWDIRKPSVVVSMNTGPMSGNQVAFSPSGGTLAVAGGDGEVKLLELVSRSVLGLSGHSGAVQSVLFNCTGQSLMSSGTDGFILLWE
uniref:Uncharacterized protein n=1 Tax=Myripristis murdjan TaxID=586833 RepID=A0A668A0S2_9TELE